ncbi:hypothetical protein [Halalkalibacillus sediminis]|uniref:hypothetical protein n=1 Tax=Halalkalibacillus sediminis TaxID=2018042 RepID=UPI00138FACAF|nr:hypothetical protein [Halalkalibacillus sediminis]
MLGWTLGAWLVVVVIPAILTAIPIVQLIRENKASKRDEHYFKHYNSEEGELR